MCANAGPELIVFLLQVDLLNAFFDIIESEVFNFRVLYLI